MQLLVARFSGRSVPEALDARSALLPWFRGSLIGMRIYLNDEEQLALAGLPYFLQVMYVFGVRRYMDYDTGMVGTTFKCSYQALREALFVEPAQGRKGGGAVSRDQVKRGLAALERIGLVKRRSVVKIDDKQLILMCPLADLGQSVQKKAARFAPWEPAPQSAPVENSDLSGSNIELLHVRKGKLAIKPAHAKTSKAARHPITDLSLSARARALEEFSDDYVPGDQALARMVRAGIPRDWAKPGHEVLEAYKARRASQLATSADWDADFALWCIRWRSNQVNQVNKGNTDAGQHRRQRNAAEAHHDALREIWREEQAGSGDDDQPG